MSAQQRIKFPRASDVKIADVFKEMSRGLNLVHVHVGLIGFADLGNVPILQAPSGLWKEVLSRDQYLIDTMSFSAGGVTVAYSRGGQFGAEQKSAIFDEIVLTQHSHQAGGLTDEQRLSVASLIDRELCPVNIGRVIGSDATEAQAQLMAIHQATFERLEGLNEKLIVESVEYRKRLDERYEERIKIADAEYAEKKLTADRDANAAIERAREKEEEFHSKLKAIDDRDNTHVRREIRERMLSDIKQRIEKFGVSLATQRKRNPVMGGIFILFFSFLILLNWTGYEIHEMNQQYYSNLEAIRNISTWGPEKAKEMGLSPETIAKVAATDVDRTHIFWLWGRFAIFSFGLVGTILYYVKWQNRWAEKHIDSEFSLQQFYIDVNRANWVIESCLEWKKETNSPIPKELLSGITNGLFVNSQTEPDRVVHPADELASALLGTASKLRLKVGDNEIDFDKPNKIGKINIAAKKPVAASKD